jgi:hypothetical protein
VQLLILNIVTTTCWQKEFDAKELLHLAGERVNFLP